jgi:DNA polymerase III subunit gamma/tau
VSYQVLARKWRPQTFDEVVGQAAVTRTLRNAIANQRIAQAFVFAGPRGVGKTTTARILARALNCVNGPTPAPCGVCDACVEIAEGRDIDVLEIDAATHTGVDNVREVIIAGLSITPVRNRYKIFIIDEVHQLSGPSFNALLKSIEEPPPHVVFMMATTELSKIPDTVLSRSQVYEFKTIGTQAIADQLKKIAGAEGVAVTDAALALIARAADGSMRDAESAFDQVIAFAGERVTDDDVSTVLGLVGRDLLFDIAQAVVDEAPSAAFELAGRAVELGYDLRLVCRELARLVRDLLVVSVDKGRAADPEIAAESERERLLELAGRFSREDLLRAFDVWARAEQDVKTAAQPRYHLEMALLRWIHLRKLVPLTDVIERLGSGQLPASAQPSPRPPFGASSAAPAPPSRPKPAASAVPTPARPTAATPPTATRPERPSNDNASSSTARPAAESAAPPAAPAGTVKQAFLAEVRKGKPSLYGMVIAQAQKIEQEGDRLVFTFGPTHRTLREQLEQNREWLDGVATRVAGRRTQVSSVLAAADKDPATGEPRPDRAAALKAEAMADPRVQALLDVFPAEIKNVEEM